jgi:hypothetical protein
MERFLYSAVYRDGHDVRTYLFVLELQPGDRPPDDDSFEVADMLGLTDFEPREHDLIIAPVENLHPDRVRFIDKLPVLPCPGLETR